MSDSPTLNELVDEYVDLDITFKRLEREKKGLDEQLQEIGRDMTRVGGLLTGLVFSDTQERDADRARIVPEREAKLALVVHGNGRIEVHTVVPLERELGRG